MMQLGVFTQVHTRNVSQHVYMYTRVIYKL